MLKLTVKSWCTESGLDSSWRTGRCKAAPSLSWHHTTLCIWRLQEQENISLKHHVIATSVQPLFEPLDNEEFVQAYSVSTCSFFLFIKHVCQPCYSPQIFSSNHRLDTVVVDTWLLKFSRKTLYSVGTFISGISHSRHCRLRGVTRWCVSRPPLKIFLQRGAARPILQLVLLYGPPEPYGALRRKKNQVPSRHP